ncbi:hypothetical protein HMPREF9439_01683 [Parasutterella excrementihominis YIT 11859]|uniref:Uncharacterized protein n=1 Tax=Parasutterella excrementihominis YIT 11859 TaxID=762966 RepID=F3QL66_9BURK|nr:hypothetical protein HMPREF9439_01683 [Parasutterella excrementihominis YIT 11859]
MFVVFVVFRQKTSIGASSEFRALCRSLDLENQGSIFFREERLLHFQL